MDMMRVDECLARVDVVEPNKERRVELKEGWLEPEG